MNNTFADIIGIIDLSGKDPIGSTSRKCQICGSSTESSDQYICNRCKNKLRDLLGIKGDADEDRKTGK